MMNESRPWWKRSWPAVVAGLVMAVGVVESNLVRQENVWIRGSWSSFGYSLGWPFRFVELEGNATIIQPQSVSIPGLMGSVIAAVLLVSGTVRTVGRWSRSRVKDPLWSVSGHLVLIATVGCILGSLSTGGADVLGLDKPLRTGVLFVGIFLTCLAVIDWIGCGWSVVSRRRATVED